MSKNPNNVDDDRTEFNFSDTEDLASSSASAPTASPSVTRARSGSGGLGSIFGGALLANGNKRKMILLLVGLIVGVIAVFKILSWVLTPSSKSTSTTNTTTAERVVSPPPASPVQK